MLCSGQHTGAHLTHKQRHTTPTLTPTTTFNTAWPVCHGKLHGEALAGSAPWLNAPVRAGAKDTSVEDAARVSYVEGDMPSLLRGAAAADAVRQYSTWLGRGCGTPLRPMHGACGASLGGWGGVRARWRGFAASAA